MQRAVGSPFEVGLWNSGVCCPRARQRPSPLPRGDSCVGRHCPRAISRLANLRILGLRDLMSSRSIGIGRSQRFRSHSVHWW